MKHEGPNIKAARLSSENKIKPKKAEGCLQMISQNLNLVHTNSQQKKQKKTALFVLWKKPPSSQRETPQREKHWASSVITKGPWF